MTGFLDRLAPDFSLSALRGGRFSLSDGRGQIVVINFWSAECPWSRRADVVLVYRQLTWKPKGVQIIGIVSNINEPQTEVHYEAENRGVNYPLLLDFDHKVADLYKAETTPHFFVLDRQGFVRYTGALDDATLEQRRPKTIYLDRAVSAILDDRTPNPAATPPYGCALVRQIVSESGPLPPQKTVS